MGPYRRGTARTLPHYLLLVLFDYLCCSVYFLCVNVYCHRVTTQLQLINISYHIHIIHAGRNTAKFEMSEFYEIQSNSKFGLKSDKKISDTLREDVSTFYC
jgi:hypothetical protein